MEVARPTHLEVFQVIQRISYNLHRSAERSAWCRQRPGCRTVALPQPGQPAPPCVTYEIVHSCVIVRAEPSVGAAAVATDIEAMRRADFLVGSFQSNVYRLGAELNMAWLVDKYPIHMDRHRTVDVEWFEDP